MVVRFWTQYFAACVGIQSLSPSSLVKAITDPWSAVTLASDMVATNPSEPMNEMLPAPLWGCTLSSKAIERDGVRVDVADRAVRVQRKVHVADAI